MGLAQLGRRHHRRAEALGDAARTLGFRSIEVLPFFRDVHDHLLRISDLDVTEYQTLASLGIPMKVIGINAKLLRDQAGNNMYYNTNSITLAGGESLDVILDASDTTKYPANSVFYLYTPNLDHLSNDAENFGGLMTEVHIN